MCKKEVRTVRSKKKEVSKEEVRTEQLFFQFKADLQTHLEGFFPACSSAECLVVSPGGRRIQVCPQVLPLHLPASAPWFPRSENPVISGLPPSQGCVSIRIHKRT